MVSWMSIKTCLCVCVYLQSAHTRIHMFYILHYVHTGIGTVLNVQYKVEVCCPMVVLRHSVFSFWRHLCWFGGFTNFPWQLVWWTHTHAHRHAHTQRTLHKHTLVLKDVNKQSWIERVQLLAHFAKVRCFQTHSVLYETSHSVKQKPHVRSTSSISQLPIQLYYSAEDASETAKFSLIVYVIVYKN